MKSVAVVSLPLLLAIASCGSDESGSSSTDVVVAAAGGQSQNATDPSDTSMSSSSDAQSTTTTTTTTLVPVRNTLAGEWRAKAADILSANLANLGGMPMACIGDIVMNLNDDGTFTRGGSMACSIDGVKIFGQLVNSSGTWDATSDTLTVTVTNSDGYAESIGPDGKAMRVPLPDGGWSSVDYEVTATTLTITFTEPSVGTVTQVYTRG